MFVLFRELDPGLEEAIASIIWASPRLQADVQELKLVTDQLTSKYGKEFAQACRTNELNNVNEKVMHKLGVQAPPKILVERYMIEIAKTYNVPFEPDPSVMSQDEIFAAENLLIDLGEKKGGGGGNGGPSGGMGVLQPQQGGGASASAPSYPPPPQSQYPPPQQLYQVQKKSIIPSLLIIDNHWPDNHWLEKILIVKIGYSAINIIYDVSENFHYNIIDLLLFMFFFTGQ